MTARSTPTSPKASFLKIRWKFSWESSKAADASPTDGDGAGGIGQTWGIVSSRSAVDLTKVNHRVSIWGGRELGPARRPRSRRCAGIVTPPPPAPKAAGQTAFITRGQYADLTP